MNRLFKLHIASIVCLLLGSFVTSIPAHAQTAGNPVLFADGMLPTGVVVGANGDVFISHFVTDGTSHATIVSKFDVNGNLLDSVTLADVVPGSLAQDPATGQLLMLRPTGVVHGINPNDLSAAAIMSIKDLNVDGGAILDVATGRVQHSGRLPWAILHADAYTVYGDIAVRSQGGVTELFVTGLSITNARGKVPFVLRIRMQAGAVQEAKVLMTAQPDAVNYGTALYENEYGDQAPRGIAVNSQGTVLTTLPLVRPGDFAPFDAPVAFQAGFNPADGVTPEEVRIVGGDIIESTGMATDANGNFYMTTGELGISGAVIAISAKLDSGKVLVPTDQFGITFHDIAISPAADRAYFTLSVSAVRPTGGVLYVPLQ